jgi:hypothetical protein
LRCERTKEEVRLGSIMLACGETKEEVRSRSNLGPHRQVMQSGHNSMLGCGEAKEEARVGATVNTGITQYLWAVIALVASVFILPYA